MKLKNLAHWILALGLSGPLLAGAADSSEPVLQPLTENGITYISGGNGLEERQALNEVSGEYNLKLVFAEKGSGSYLADVKLSIMNMKGQKVLEAVSDGPWFYVKLAPGRYKITAEAAGQSQIQQARVGGGRLAQRYFYWSVE
ncbi:MAG: hypothetical protein Q7U80_08545 [Thiobacillus sp.]|nr:hypothetical protein [Thiobacillus sp.]